MHKVAPTTRHPKWPFPSESQKVNALLEQDCIDFFLSSQKMHRLFFGVPNKCIDLFWSSQQMHRLFFGVPNKCIDLFWSSPKMHRFFLEVPKTASIFWRSPKLHRFLLGVPKSTSIFFGGPQIRIDFFWRSPNLHRFFLEVPETASIFLGGTGICIDFLEVPETASIFWKSRKLHQFLFWGFCWKLIFLMFFDDLVPFRSILWVIPENAIVSFFLWVVLQQNHTIASAHLRCKFVCWWYPRNSFVFCLQSTQQNTWFLLHCLNSSNVQKTWPYGTEFYFTLLSLTWTKFGCTSAHKCTCLVLLQPPQWIPASKLLQKNHWVQPLRQVIPSSIVSLLWLQPVTVAPWKPGEMDGAHVYVKLGWRKTSPAICCCYNCFFPPNAVSVCLYQALISNLPGSLQSTNF